MAEPYDQLTPDSGPGPDRARGETELERVDRNFTDLLQELRVAQTGVQILVAFLLSMAFAPRFTELGDWQRLTYLVTLLLGATSAAALIAPVMYHRLLFRRRRKPNVVMVTHRFAIAGLTLMLFALVGAVGLASSMVVGEGAIWIAVVLGVLFIVLWYLVPLWRRRDGDQT